MEKEEGEEGEVEDHPMSGKRSELQCNCFQDKLEDDL